MNQIFWLDGMLLKLSRGAEHTLIIYSQFCFTGPNVRALLSAPLIGRAHDEKHS